ncbi:hypothetical protein QK342_14885 [Myroides odoratimimus]|uniref:hypothetical protein n=1 Tax=Myroides odoratimimus TaxID=76832 RepID=UPI0010408CEB|nr:hypothetical protein [Myroides odoratimimus]MEC4076485.1 hypothetical protein [Myroides odoratimimus]QBK77531.1 hypothetical protein E0Z07_14805 [Myroides odoratimimus]WHT72976.1 hypothetical protein QK342_14885 [Myroides odoratimimus]WHU37559.1 hypothetical protein QNM93_14875 [Myroides odoratimimus]
MNKHFITYAIIFSIIGLSIFSIYKKIQNQAFINQFISTHSASIKEINYFDLGLYTTLKLRDHQGNQVDFSCCFADFEKLTHAATAHLLKE